MGVGVNLWIDWMDGRLFMANQHLLGQVDPVTLLPVEQEPEPEPQK